MGDAPARIVIGNASRSARQIGDLAPLLKENCEPELYSELKMGAGTVVCDIYQSILEPAFRRFPHLKEEFERNIDRYGSGS